MLPSTRQYQIDKAIFWGEVSRESATALGLRASWSSLIRYRESTLCDPSEGCRAQHGEVNGDTPTFSSLNRYSF